MDTDTSGNGPSTRLLVPGYTLPGIRACSVRGPPMYLGKPEHEARKIDHLSMSLETTAHNSQGLLS